MEMTTLETAGTGFNADDGDGDILTAAGREVPTVPWSGAPGFVLDIHGRLRFANADGQRVLDAGSVLMPIEGRLMPRERTQWASWLSALLGVQATGLPRFFFLGGDGRSVMAALKPDSAGPGIRVSLERGKLCDEATLRAYAQHLNLTRREARVLDLLSAGLTPRDIADSNGTAEATVRTQIKSLLNKTRCPGLRELMIQIGRLPSIG
ncbi:MAG: LuxR C-terminal-related transcriptional regulator [Burkholderiaceae bacterium]